MLNVSLSLFSNLLTRSMFLIQVTLCLIHIVSSQDQVTQMLNSSALTESANLTVEATVNPQANHHGSTFGMSEEFLLGTLVSLACLSVLIPCILVVYYKNRTDYFVGIRKRFCQFYPSMTSSSDINRLHNDVEQS